MNSLKKTAWILTTAALCLFSSACQSVSGLMAQQAQATATAAPTIVPTPVPTPTYQAQIVDSSSQVQEMQTEFASLQYQESRVNEIPVLEVASDLTDAGEPVVVFLHGVTGTKDQMSYLLSRIAEQGFHAVSIDLPGHGQRTDGPYMFLDVLQQGMQDLDTVLGYLEQEGFNLSHYAMGGFSAGAIITYLYGMEGKYQPDLLIPVSGVLDLDRLEDSRLLDQCYEGSVIIPATGTHEAALQELKQMIQAEDVSRLAGREIVISHGTEDTTFSYELAQQASDELSALDGTAVSLNLFDTGHVFPDAFLQIMLDSMVNHFKTES